MRVFMALLNVSGRLSDEVYCRRPVSSGSNETKNVGFEMEAPSSPAPCRRRSIKPLPGRRLNFLVAICPADLVFPGSSNMSDSGSTSSSGHQHASTTKKNNSGDDEIRFPVLTNPLLAVAQSSWLETAVSAGAERWVPHFPPRFGDNEGTMRGSDPGLPPPIRARCDATRDWSARLLAFAVPNRRAVDACRRALEACRSGGGQGRPGSAADGGIVEVGAGLGYWKWVVEGSGAFSGGGSGGGSGGNDGRESKGTAPLTFLAIDKDPSRLPGSGGSENPDVVNDSGRNHRGQARGKNRGGQNGTRKGRGQQRPGGRPEGSAGPTHNEYHGGAPAWAVVEKGGPERLQTLSAAAYPVLLLCYPPPSIGGGSNGKGCVGCMGADALEKFSGKVLLYVGEVGGDTGSPRLEAALRANWDLVEAVDLPCFPSTANRLMVFLRKGALQGMQATTMGRSGASSATDGDTSGGGGDGWGPTVAMCRCSGCGVRASGDGEKGVRLHRCRLTRAVSYCSEKCLERDSGRWQANLEARHVFLAAGTAARVAQHSGRYGAVFRDRKLFKRLPPPP